MGNGLSPLSNVFILVLLKASVEKVSSNEKLYTNKQRPKKSINLIRYFFVFNQKNLFVLYFYIN